MDTTKSYCTDPRHGEPCPLPCNACAEECRPMKSYRPMVFVQGEWSGNGLRFATYAEAEENALDLMSRWTLVQDLRVDESEDPVNYRWDNATRTLTNIETGKGYVPPRSVTL